MNYRKALNLIPDNLYVRLQYYYLTGRILHLKHPVRYNEKLQWLKLYDRNPQYTEMVDKYLVKKYVEQLIGKTYVVPMLGVWENVDDIDVQHLPDQFVLKTTHDSKGVLVCKNKNEFSLDKAKEFFYERLNNNGYYYGREWPYLNIKPRVIAEKYLQDDSGGLRDYKVMCFNGEPKLIQLHQGRFSDNYYHDIYDTNWILQPYNQKGEKSSGVLFPRPVFLEDMLEKSAILSSGIPHVRVDWYYANNQLYFGEMTFFDASGYLDFIPDRYNEILGSWITLP